jgi:DNA modification methylase
MSFESRIEFGDCRDTMRRWASDGVKAQMCVTSPPYFGLRSYGGGDSEIGKEATPEAFICAMVEVFRCVHDVLADDGVMFLNIGDSHYNYRTGNKGGMPGQTVHAGKQNGKPSIDEGCLRRATKLAGIQEKELIGIPWMLAFALRADGWLVRQEIIWSKPNPTPEKVTDRFTRSHEQMFLLTKKPHYFFDSTVVMEAGVDGLPRRKRSVWEVPTSRAPGAHFATFPPALIEPCILAGSRPGDMVLDPFMGSGTTAAVALQHGRQYLGCELNPEYGPLQQQRIDAERNLFT